MFLIIGLKQDGRMVLYDAPHDEPNENNLTYAAREFRYRQILVITSEGTQIARYEFEPTPKLRNVPLV